MTLLGWIINILLNGSIMTYSIHISRRMLVEFRRVLVVSALGQ